MLHWWQCQHRKGANYLSVHFLLKHLFQLWVVIQHEVKSNGLRNPAYRNIFTITISDTKMWGREGLQGGWKQEGVICGGEGEGTFEECSLPTHPVITDRQLSSIITKFSVTFKLPVLDMRISHFYSKRGTSFSWAQIAILSVPVCLLTIAVLIYRWPDVYRYMEYLHLGEWKGHAGSKVLYHQDWLFLFRELRIPASKSLK